MKNQMIALLISLGSQVSACGTVEVPPTKVTEAKPATPAADTTDTKDKGKLPSTGVIENDARLVGTMGDLPACAGDYVDRIFYVMEKDQFYTCTSGGDWKTVDLRGPAGPKGDSGSDGAKGENGKGAVAVYGGNDQYIGTAMGSLGNVRLDDGSILMLTAAGKYAPPYGISTGFTNTACSHTTTDCSGTCYVAIPDSLIQPSNDLTSLVRSSLYYSSTGWLKVKGDETHITSPTHMKSYMDGESVCRSYVWTSNSAFILTNQYTMTISPAVPFTGFGDLYFK